MHMNMHILNSFSSSMFEWQHLSRSTAPQLQFPAFIWHLAMKVAFVADTEPSIDKLALLLAFGVLLLTAYIAIVIRKSREEKEKKEEKEEEEEEEKKKKKKMMMMMMMIMKKKNKKKKKKKKKKKERKKKKEKNICFIRAL